MASNKDIVRRVIEEAYGAGNSDILDELCADGYVYHEPLLGELDREGEKQLVQGYRRAFPDLQVEILDLFAEGELVCARWRASGTHKGQIMGEQPSGNRITVHGTDVTRFENGKAVENWTSYDTFGFLRQTGSVTSAEEQEELERGAPPPA